MYLYGNSRGERGYLFYFFMMNRISFNLYGHNNILIITHTSRRSVSRPVGDAYLERVFIILSYWSVHIIIIIILYYVIIYTCAHIAKDNNILCVVGRYRDWDRCEIIICRDRVLSKIFKWESIPREFQSLYGQHVIKKYYIDRFRRVARSSLAGAAAERPKRIPIYIYYVYDDSINYNSYISYNINFLNYTRSSRRRLSLGIYK